MKASWIKVDREKLNEPRQETIAGVNVTVYFLPSEMPSAVRGIYDADKRRFAIEFSYLTGNEEQAILLDAQVDRGEIAVYVGSESNRVQRLELDVDSMQVGQIDLNVKKKLAFEKAEQVLDEFAEKKPTSRRRRVSNFRAVRQALVQNHGELVGT